MVSRMPRPALLAALLLSAAVPLAPVHAAAPRSAADARFQALYRREWAWRQAQRGEVGEDDDSGRVRPLLPKVDPATQAARLAYWRGVMGALGRIDPKALSPAEAENYAVYRAQIQVLIDQQAFREWEKPLTGDSAFWSDRTDVARQPFRRPDDYAAYLSQLHDLPRYFDEEIADMRAGLKRGFTPPRVTLEGRDTGIRSVAEAATPQDTVWWGPFKAFPSGVASAEQARLRREGERLIREEVQPAYRRLLAFWTTEYLPGARTELAATRLPDGRAYYQSLILEYTTTTMTPEQIHAFGVSETAKIHAEMLQAMHDAGWKGDFPSFLHFLKTDPQFHPKTAEEELKDAAFIAKEFDGKADRWFGYLPRRRFAIVPVPPDIAPFYTAGRGGLGRYLVNTYDLPSRALYALPALTLHESAPGHAMQLPIAAEQTDLPEFRSRSYISAYGEGWAVYCERLGDEMGMYHTPYERFGMLSYQAWRTARLVVDTGVHAMGWTRAQAQAYLRENTALSDHEVETETDRYISWPGQALSYYLGEDVIRRARAKAEAALGPRFDIRRFHDTVLKLGSVPLPVLEARIDRFIAEGGPAPYPKGAAGVTP